MARTQNLSGIIRGDARVFAVDVVDSNGDVVDISGNTMFLTVNANNDPTTDTGAVIAVQWTPVYAEYDGVIYDPTQGNTYYLLTNEIMQNITAQLYNYDVQMVDGNGNPTSIPQATFNVTADITRRV